MRIYMIRHGKTKGNLEHRYVGSTDEPLLLETEEQLKKQKMSQPDILYISPMKRCRQTAELLYPGKQAQVIDDFKECDFGIFEYKNYEELNGNPDYQTFIDTMGMCGFPQGESRKTFQERCTIAFEKILLEQGNRDITAAMVVHGGTMMAVMDAYAKPHEDYYHWQVENGAGFYGETVWDENKQKYNIINIQKIEIGE